MTFTTSLSFVLIILCRPHGLCSFCIALCLLLNSSYQRMYTVCGFFYSLPSYNNIHPLLWASKSTSISFSQLRQAAQNDEPVYFMLTPPDQPDPGLLQDCYVDTSTLQWLYDPPIGVVGGQLPEHMNLSSKRLFSCR